MALNGCRQPRDRRRLTDFSPRPESSSPISRAMVEVQHEGGPGEQKGDSHRHCARIGIRRRNPQLRIGGFDWSRDRRGVCRLRKAKRSLEFTGGDQANREAFFQSLANFSTK
jgi:hypothetical protein